MKTLELLTVLIMFGMAFLITLAQVYDLALIHGWYVAARTVVVMGILVIISRHVSRRVRKG